MTEWYWECNECGSREFTSSVSEEDLDYMACTSCGCNEFHKEYEKMNTEKLSKMKTIYVVLDIDSYGSPEIVDYHLTEDEAQEHVAKMKYLGYENSKYEILELRK
jgi:hypothetical protein